MPQKNFYLSQSRFFVTKACFFLQNAIFLMSVLNLLEFSKNDGNRADVNNKEQNLYLKYVYKIVQIRN